LGVGLGYLLQIYVLDVLLLEETGYTFMFLFPISMTLLTAAFAIAGAQVAGALPAARAAWQSVTEAVAYE
jgi:ABC-type antimicrobial peptide transport system permease subunit